MPRVWRSFHPVSGADEHRLSRVRFHGLQGSGRGGVELVDTR
jgi:hypothetical protein